MWPQLQAAPQQQQQPASLAWLPQVLLPVQQQQQQVSELQQALLLLLLIPASHLLQLLPAHLPLLLCCWAPKERLCHLQLGQLLPTLLVQQGLT
jgi:hypothetical protein